MVMKRVHLILADETLSSVQHSEFFQGVVDNTLPCKLNGTIPENKHLLQIKSTTIIDCTLSVRINRFCLSTCLVQVPQGATFLAEYMNFVIKIFPVLIKNVSKSPLLSYNDINCFTFVKCGLLSHYSPFNHVHFKMPNKIAHIIEYTLQNMSLHYNRMDHVQTPILLPQPP